MLALLDDCQVYQLLFQTPRSMSSDDGDYQVEESIPNHEAIHLLDRYWFFGTTPPPDHKSNTKTMLRSLSEPCATASGSGSGSSADRRCQEELSKDAKSATNEEGKSLSDCYAEITKGKEGLPVRLPWQGLVRAPSLPLDIGRKEETSIRSPRMNMTMRQVSLHLPDVRPARHSLKGVLQSSSVPRYRSNIYANSIKSKKSLSDLEKEEVQGFKDLGFSFEDKDLNHNLVTVLPGLQEKIHENEERSDNTVQRPYLSEAWIVQSYAPPPIPKWNSKGSPEDMKAHIKHWARVVASNVR